MNEIFKTNNLKATKPRLAIFLCLKRSRRPLTADDIYLRLRKKVNRATVYRNLELLRDSEIIFSEHYQNKSYYYFAKSPHHHIICRSCGRVECVPCYHQRSFKVKDFTAITHEMKLEGICNNCLKSTK